MNIVNAFREWLNRRFPVYSVKLWKFATLAQKHVNPSCHYSDNRTRFPNWSIERAMLIVGKPSDHWVWENQKRFFWSSKKRIHRAYYVDWMIEVKDLSRGE